MAILNELNKLAEKMTGENPNKTKISDALDVIVEYLSGGNNDETQVSTIIHKIADNYSGGSIPQLNLIPITEDMDFSNLVLPKNLKVTLEKNILDYFSAADKAEIEQQVQDEGYASHYFYQYVDIPHFDEEEPSGNSITDMNLYLSINEDGHYKIYFEGYTHREEHNDSNEFHVTFTSLDGVNFFVSTFSILYYDYDTGTEYSVIPQKMEFPVTINFSEVVNGSEDAKGWNDVLSEFLFTDEE